MAPARWKPSDSGQGLWTCGTSQSHSHPGLFPALGCVSLHCTPCRCCVDEDTGSYDPASLGYLSPPSCGAPHDRVSPLPPQGSSSDDTELRYSSQYEERLDPFSSFSKRVCEPSLLHAGQGRAGACCGQATENPPAHLASASPHPHSTSLTLSPPPQTSRAAFTPALVPWGPRVHPHSVQSARNICWWPHDGV